MKLKRRPLKTIPWDRKAKELKQATQRWVDSGGDPDLFKNVERLTREVRKLAMAATPTRKKVTSKTGLPGYLRDWLEESKLAARQRVFNAVGFGDFTPPFKVDLHGKKTGFGVKDSGGRWVGDPKRSMNLGSWADTDLMLFKSEKTANLFKKQLEKAAR